MALTSRDDVKTYLGITDGLQDARIDLLLPMVDKILEGFTRRALNEKVIVGERQHGRGSPLFYTRHSPIQSVQLFELIDPTNGGITVKTISVNEFDIAGFDTDAGVGEYIILTGTQTRIVVMNHPWNGPVFPVGFNNVRIDYTAGYPSGNIPADLQLAAIRTVGFQLDQTSAGFSSEKINKYSYTRNLGSAGSDAEKHPDIPAEAIGTLRSYRRIKIERATHPTGEAIDRRFISR